MHIKSETENSVLVWQINRPDRRNALGPILAQELREKLEELKQKLPTWPSKDAPIRALVIKALSDKGDSRPIWIAGGDLRELNELKTEAEGRSYAEIMSQVSVALETLPIPVLAVIDGLVIGGGIEFAIAADVRIATKRSRFHFKQLELGLATAYASAGRLTQLIGASRAMHWLLRSQSISAETAFHAGLVSEIYDDKEDMEQGLKSLLADILRLNPSSIAAQKAMFRRHTINIHEEAEIHDFGKLWMNDFHKASLKKFLSPE